MTVLGWQNLFDSVRMRAISLWILAFGLRMVYVASVGWSRSALFTNDSFSYDRFARLMLGGWGWLTTPLAVREPLYPAVIALGYGLPGSELVTLMIIQAMGGAFVPVIIYLGLRRLVRESVALIGGLLTACHPQFVFYGAHVQREWLVILLLAGFLVLLLNAARSSRWTGCLWAGGALALLVHTDVRFLPLLPAYFLVLWIAGGTFRHAVRQSLLLTSVLAVLMIPYMIRGYAAFHRPVVVTERFLGMWLPLVGRAAPIEDAQHEQQREDWLRQWEAHERERLDTLSTAERAAFERGERPAMTAWGIYGYRAKEYWRFARFRPEFAPYLDGRLAPRWSIFHDVSGMITVIPFLFLMPFAWYRSPSAERRIYAAVVLLILSHFAMHVAVHIQERYRVPIEPATAVLTAAGLVNLVGVLPVRRWFGRMRPARAGA